MTVESITVHAVPSELCLWAFTGVSSSGGRPWCTCCHRDEREGGDAREREGLRGRGQTQSGWATESSGGAGRVCGHTRLWC